jgi:hypothetical protein
MRSITSLIVACTTCLSLTGRSQAPTVDQLLHAAGDYLKQYEKDVAAIVAEEDYVQRLPNEGARTRRLRSDMLVLLDPAYGWVSFRDVFEADGSAVRDRDERLVNLFLHPKPDTIAQARRVVEEGSRFNLNPQGGGINRTINQPLLALKFLRATSQSRSEFKIDGTRTGTDAVVVTFTERIKPRLIASPDNAAGRGAFWIDPATGRVTTSELTMQTGGTRVVIRVAYAKDAKLDLWLPSRMDETYGPVGFPAIAWIEGRATYSKFRRFQVDTSEAVK